MKSAHGLLLAMIWLVPVTGAQTVVAQDLVSTSFGQLRSTVKAGDTLHVTDKAGHEITGTMADLSPSSLVLVADGVRRDFSEQDVARITKDRNHVLAGATIGLSAGVAAGLLAGAAECSLERSYCPGRPLYRGGSEAIGFGALGAGIGAWIGARKHSQRLVYGSPVKSTAVMTVSPSWTREGKGIAASIRF